MICNDTKNMIKTYYGDKKIGDIRVSHEKRLKKSLGRMKEYIKRYGPIPC